MVLDQEIIESFTDEANAIVEDLRLVVEKLEDHQGQFPRDLLEEFANKADRLMGTCQTFAAMYPNQNIFIQIGKFGELCKATGYKAAAIQNDGLVPIFAAFWADTIDIIAELCQNIGNEDKLKLVTQSYIPVLQKRLTWLAQQIVNLTKGSASASTSAINVDGILRRMGITV
jgi:hypothetical protein